MCAAEASPDPPRRRCRVLIVENNEDLARSISELLTFEPDLESAGWTASAANALAEAHRVSADVVLLDLSLSDGSGFSVLEQARREAPHLKIILYTGHASDELTARARAKGAVACLAKGGDFEELSTEIRRAYQQIAAPAD